MCDSHVGDMGMMDREYMIRKESENSLPCFPLKIQGFEFFSLLLIVCISPIKRERLCVWGVFYGSKSRYLEGPETYRSRCIGRYVN